MRLDPAHVEHARKVADAVLYEGYLLYPYRGSAQKNQTRFQFGVLVPPAYAAADDTEQSASQTECLVDCRDDAVVTVAVRFLHLVHRTGTDNRPWDEAMAREHRVTVGVAALLAAGENVHLRIAAGEASEDLPGSGTGRLVRRWNALDATVRLSAQRVAGPQRTVRLRVRVENHTLPEPLPGSRDEALRWSLVAAHALIGVPGGRFLSLTDPPEWAAAEAAACENIGAWPVLAGPADCHDLVLSAPVILSDHPEVAPESAGDLFDATEIDEILTLRTLALTDEEKREARATDPRAAALIDRLDSLPPEMFERMHGAIRYLRSVPGAAAAGAAAAVPAVPGAAAAGAAVPGPAPPSAAGAPQWWDPGSDTSVSPETDHVLVDGVPVARGSRVVMCPGKGAGARRADAQDLFLAGRTALVEAVLSDVDGQVHVAVSPDDDPAADLQRSHGRFLYFAPDELEPVTADRRKT